MGGGKVCSPKQKGYSNSHRENIKVTHGNIQATQHHHIMSIDKPRLT